LERRKSAVIWLTPYDWLVFGGLAINCLAFFLMFGRKA
jgi:hypothetical protein